MTAIDLVILGENAKERVASEPLLAPFAAAQCIEGRDSCRLLDVLQTPSQALALRRGAKDAKLEYAFVPAALKLADIKAVFFDMDSTLCSTETLDEIARICGLGEACAEITHKAMTGEIADYAASLRARVALLKGHDASVIETVKGQMQPNPGIPEFLKVLHERGIATYIVSSGFTIMAEPMREKLGMTGICANRIEIRDGKFTGEVAGFEDDTILDAAGKAAFVARTMRAMGSDTAHAICCGDGSNDVRMIDLAGIGVGFRPKNVLRGHCTISLDEHGFDSIPDLFADSAR